MQTAEDPHVPVIFAYFGAAEETPEGRRFNKDIALIILAGMVAVGGWMWFNG